MTRVPTLRRMAKSSMRGVPDPTLKLTTVSADQLNLAGKRLVVIGGTDGLGRAIARLAASRGAKVTVVGRTFRDADTPGMDFVRADLSSMKEAARLGRELAVEGVDLVALTHGIIAAPQREATAEGIERDMAVSYLSRLAILRELAPRLREGARVFVMGFPGAGNRGDAADLNAERAYDAMAVHMNTVAGNEMLVLDAKDRYPRVGVYGLNPGLVRTNIRANLLGEGSLKHRVAEFFIGLFTPSPEDYAAKVLPAMFAPELAGRSGALLGAKGQAILPTEGMTADHVATFLRASATLVDGALAR